MLLIWTAHGGAKQDDANEMALAHPIENKVERAY